MANHERENPDDVRVFDGGGDDEEEGGSHLPVVIVISGPPTAIVPPFAKSLCTRTERQGTSCCESAMGTVPTVITPLWI